MTVLWVYAMRRVERPQCGIRVEQVPWGHGKCQQTRSYRLYLARWAKRLPWQEVARIFNTSWDSVYRAVRFVTLVYQIDSGSRRLLWIGRDCTEKTLHGFFDLMGSQLRPTLRYVCSNMWSAYLTTVAERAERATEQNAMADVAGTTFLAWCRHVNPLDPFVSPIDNLRSEMFRSWRAEYGSYPDESSKKVRSFFSLGGAPDGTPL